MGGKILRPPQDLRIYQFLEEIILMVFCAAFFLVLPRNGERTLRDNTKLDLAAPVALNLTEKKVNFKVRFLGA